MKKRVRRAADRAGLGPPLVALYGRLNPTWRRDRIDNDHLRLLLAFSLSHDSNCIDVGAHEGSILGEMVRLAPAGNHIAYEPLPDLCRRLATEFPQVDVRQAALSNDTGVSSFTYVRSLPGYSGLREREYPQQSPELDRITVSTETLDSTLPDEYVPHFLKVDVEGAERLVFEGAIETLKRHRPIIFFEHGQGASEHYGTRPSDIYDLLVGEAGMRIFDADGRGPYTPAEFDAVFSEPIWNFVAHA